MLKCMKKEKFLINNNNNNNLFPFCTLTVHFVIKNSRLFTSIAVPYVQKVGVGLELMFI